ncbi:MAG: GAF domain-containing protein [Sphingomonadales bacterium]
MYRDDVVERARMACLRNLNILDTAADERLDQVTCLAAEHFDVAISVLSLVDTERQWFKSKVGLAAFQTPRCHAFCDHTIRSQNEKIVEDATKDERFANNPLVLGDPNIRFYAGTPITIDNTYRIGSLCIIDAKPRQFKDRDVAKLVSMGKTMERLISQIYLTSDVLERLADFANQDVAAR